MTGKEGPEGSEGLSEAMTEVHCQFYLDEYQLTLLSRSVLTPG